MFELARIKIRDPSDKNSDTQMRKKRLKKSVWLSFFDATVGVQTGSLTKRGKVHS